MAYSSTDEEMKLLREATDRAPSIFNQCPWDLRRVADDRVNLCSAPAEELGRLLGLYEAMWFRRTCTGPDIKPVPRHPSEALSAEPIPRHSYDDLHAEPPPRHEENEY